MPDISYIPPVLCLRVNTLLCQRKHTEAAVLCRVPARSLIWAVTRAQGCDVSVTCNVTCNITCNVTCNAWITFIATVTMMDVLYTPKVTFVILLILIFAIFGYFLKI